MENPHFFFAVKPETPIFAAPFERKGNMVR